MSGITWNSQYLATRDGILMSVQVGTGLLGGLVAAGPGTQLEAFIYWMTFLVSGIFLISFSSSLIQTLEEKIPYFYKIHFFYLCIWSLFLIIDVLYRFIYWNIVSVFTWALLFAFLIQLFFKYRMASSSEQNEAPAAAEGQEPAKF